MFPSLWPTRDSPSSASRPSPLYLHLTPHTCPAARAGRRLDVRQELGRRAHSSTTACMAALEEDCRASLADATTFGLELGQQPHQRMEKGPSTAAASPTSQPLVQGAAPPLGPLVPKARAGFSPRLGDRRHELEGTARGRRVMWYGDRWGGQRLACALPLLVDLPAATARAPTAVNLDDEAAYGGDGRGSVRGRARGGWG